MTTSFGVNPYGKTENDCCYCLSTGNLRNIWMKEKQSCLDGRLVSGCGYGVLWRATSLVRTVVCAPYNLVGAVLWEIAGVVSMVSSVISCAGICVGSIVVPCLMEEIDEELEERTCQCLIGGCECSCVGCFIGGRWLCELISFPINFIASEAVNHFDLNVMHNTAEKVEQQWLDHFFEEYEV